MLKRFYLGHYCYLGCISFEENWRFCISVHVFLNLSIVWEKYTCKMSNRMTKPIKWPVHPAKTQISLSICPVWSESLLSAWRNTGPLITYWVHSEDSDQIGWMPRLIWVFVWRTSFCLIRVLPVCMKKRWALNYLLSAQWRLIRLESLLGTRYFVGFVMQLKVSMFLQQVLLV